MMTPGTSTPLRNTQTVRTVEMQRTISRSDLDTVAENSTSSTCLFAALPSDTATICPTPPAPKALLPAAKEAAANQPLPPNDAFKTPVLYIIKLVDEQLDRLEHEYKHAFFISKSLNRTKYTALTLLKKDLNETTFPTHDNLIQRLHQTSNDKDVVKGIIFRSKVKAMFVAIFAYIEKEKIYDETRKNYQNNIHKDSKKITTLPLSLQKKILGYLGVEDTQAVLLTSRTLQGTQPVLKINYWREKLVLIGVRKDLVCRLPDYIKFDILYQKIKILTAYLLNTTTELELWMLAFLSGNEKFIQTVLISNPDLQKTTSTGMNALHCAAIGGNIKIFKFVFENSNLHIDNKDNYGENTLHFAALGGNTEIFKYILKNLTINFDSKNNHGTNILHFAALGGNINMFTYIVENSNIPIDSKNNNGLNFLHCAALGGNIKMFEHILKYSNIPIDSKNNNGLNSLHCAAISGNTNMFTYILKNSNIPIDSKDNVGKNSLHYVAMDGNINMFIYIIENLNIPIDSKDKYDKNTLHYAAWGGNIKMFTYILEHSNIPIDSKNNNGINYLHCAAVSVNINMFTYILEHSNIPIDSKNNNGENSLHFAAMTGRAKTILFLRKVHNFSPLLQTNNGEDAFAIARSTLAGDKLASTLEALSTPVEEIPDSVFR